MSKLFLKIKPQPRLYLSVSPLRKSPQLYLDMEKANPHRDPARGTYIGGGAIKANTEDLSEKLEELFSYKEDK